MRVSIIIPAYNEERTLREALRRVRAVPLDKEIIVVDDGSRDGTAAVVADEMAKDPGLIALRHERNRGKGAAVLTGLARASGDVAIVQDADLELDPEDIPAVVAPIAEGHAVAVYGTRFATPDRGVPAATLLGNRVVTGVANLLYAMDLTDEACGYKAMPTALWRELGLRASRFELCAEVTAKLRLRGVPIAEVPVSFAPRSIREGKKVRIRDGFTTLLTLVQIRLGLDR